MLTVTKGLEEAKHQVVESERQKHQLLAVIENQRTQLRNQQGAAAVSSGDVPSDDSAKVIEGLRAQIEGLNLAHVALKRQFEAEVSEQQTQAQGAGSISSGFTQNNDWILYSR